MTANTWIVVTVIILTSLSKIIIIWRMLDRWLRRVETLVKLAELHTQRGVEQKEKWDKSLEDIKCKVSANPETTAEKVVEKIEPLLPSTVVDPPSGMRTAWKPPEPTQ